jgi:hypothetical protein
VGPGEWVGLAVRALAVAVTIGAGSGAAELTSPWPRRLPKATAEKAPGLRRSATGAAAALGKKV